MAVPTLITDVYTTAGSNPPGGGETPAEGDNHLRAAYSFIAQLRDILNGTSSTTAAVQSLAVSGAAAFAGTSTFNGASIFNGDVTIGNAAGDALTINPNAITLGNAPTITGAATWASAQTFSSNPAGRMTGDTYTPTLTSVSNVSSSTAYVCQYLRVGPVVTVSGLVDVATTSAADTQIGISLPIASNFTAQRQCGGAAVCAASSANNVRGSILADATNDRANLQFISLSGAGLNHPLSFTFTYLVI